MCFQQNMSIDFIRRSRWNVGAIPTPCILSLCSARLRLAISPAVFSSTDGGGAGARVRSGGAGRRTRLLQVAAGERQISSPPVFGPTARGGCDLETADP